MIIRDFQDTADYYDYSAGPSDAMESARTSRRPLSPGYNLTANYGEALTLSREGWAEGRARVSEFLSQLSGILASKIRKQVCEWDVSGDMVDIGRYVEGVPENMIRFEEIEDRAHGRLLTLVVSMTTAAGIRTAEITRRGAAICALVDALEGTGFRVEIIIGNFLALHTTRLVAKRHGDPLDVDRLAFMLCHPDMQRRIQFSVTEREDGSTRFRMGFRSGGGYGAGGIVDAYGADRGDIYFPSLFARNCGDYRSDEAALSLVIAELRRQGVEVAD